MLQRERELSGQGLPAEDIPRGLRVVIRSGSPWCRAALIYGGQIGSSGVEPQYIFAETRRCDSDLTALFTLMQITQKKLDDLWGAHIERAPGTTHYVDGMGHGQMYY
jgi:hypothetical protein